MLRRAVELDPNNNSAHYLLAQVLQQTGRAEEAKREFEAAERLQGGVGSLKAAALPRSASPPPPAARRPWPVTFVDVAERAGLRHASVYGGLDRKRFIIETNGAGVAWLDYDDDGRLDAFVLSGTRLAEGGRAAAAMPAEAPHQSPLPQPRRRHVRGRDRCGVGSGRTGWASGVCAGDYDNDGRLDMLVTYYGQNVLYRNRGGGLRGRDRARGAARGRRALGLGLQLRRLRPRRPARPLRLELPVLRRRPGAGARRRARTACGRASPSIAAPRGCPPTSTSSIATAATARSRTSPPPPASRASPGATR